MARSNRRPGSSGQSGRRRRVAGHPRPGSEEQHGQSKPRPSPRPRPSPTARDGDNERPEPQEQQAGGGAADEPAEETAGEVGEHGEGAGEAGDAAADTAGTTSTDGAEDAASTGDTEGASSDEAGAPDAVASGEPVESGESRESGTGERLEEHEVATRPDGQAESAPAAAGVSAATDQAEPAAGQAGSDATAAGSDAEPEPVGEQRSERPAGRSAVMLTSGLAAGAVLLAGAAGFFGYQYSQVSGALDNKALVDGPATAEVKEDISAAVERVLSYDYNAIEETEQAAEDLLVNDEVRQDYNELYSEVKRIAPEQQMVLTTRVSRLGVMELDDDHARLLVFVDQAATREGQEDSNVGGSQLTIVAERHDEGWKIADLDTYTDDDEAGAPAEEPAEDGGQPLPDGDGGDGGEGGDDGTGGAEEGGE
ncbi:hypothetical protein [Haloechinothrix sp. LS1_15]|uniref:hypothetical protein n=1 Tax=Haloechinothrix sp. LS1_15 TaxID=2652248 RepID=UPI0029478F39|nr:hypothetical protein [Haloechinothrix sp. LS1_15]MDV6013143.1 hypothetical protein [Haloechinothrix sp. LS1_15]